MDGSCAQLQGLHGELGLIKSGAISASIGVKYTRGANLRNRNRLPVAGAGKACLGCLGLFPAWRSAAASSQRPDSSFIHKYRHLMRHGITIYRNALRMERPARAPALPCGASVFWPMPMPGPGPRVICVALSYVRALPAFAHRPL